MNNNINKANIAKIKKQNKALKIIVVILLIVTAFTIAIAHNFKVQLHMNEYAITNDCQWHYSSYIDEEPVCK